MKDLNKALTDLAKASAALAAVAKRISDKPAGIDMERRFSSAGGVVTRRGVR